MRRFQNISTKTIFFQLQIVPCRTAREVMGEGCGPFKRRYVYSNGPCS